MSSDVAPAPPLVAIAGPTAAGKTAFALHLVAALAAQGQPAEIVSVDSAQVYRGMDIGTAKPDQETLRRVRHHLIDIADPSEPYSAARFATDAALAIAAVRAQGRVPVLVGGTMLYFRALFDGLSELPSANAALRAQFELEAADLGWGALHAKLAVLDPQTAARLHPNDAQRIQRALEVVQLSGAPMGALPKVKNRRQVPEPIIRFAVRPPERSRFLANIERRFEGMMVKGFLDEVSALRGRGDLNLELPSMRAVGYRQLWRHLEGDYSLDSAVHLAVVATRQYAKRQMTWLRGEGILWRWIDPTEPNSLASVLNLFNESQQ